MAIVDLMTQNPKVSISVISILVTFVMTLFTKYFTNQDRMKELKKIQKACQIKLKDVKGDTKKQQEIQKQMMECSMEMMKHSFKPMIFTFLPLLILFWWLREIYPPILSSWLWWYIGVSIASSMILRKILKVA